MFADGLVCLRLSFVVKWYMYTMAAFHVGISWSSFSCPQRVCSHTLNSYSESDDKRQPTGDAEEPNETHYADDAHVEDSTEPPLARVDPGKGMENSPLSRLPPELRTMIFKMALISSIGISLQAGHVSYLPSRNLLENGYVLYKSTDPQGTLIETMSPMTLWVLGFMTTCHQIRSEAKKLLSFNDFNVHGVDFDQITSLQHGILHTIRLIRSVTSFLGMSFGRVVL